MLFGAMVPYDFAAWTLESVGKAANDMVKVCLEQISRTMGPEKMTPDYEKCIRSELDDYGLGVKAVLAA